MIERITSLLLVHHQQSFLGTDRTIATIHPPTHKEFLSYVILGLQKLSLIPDITRAMFMNTFLYTRTTSWLYTKRPTDSCINSGSGTQYLLLSTSPNTKSRFRKHFELDTTRPVATILRGVSFLSVSLNFQLLSACRGASFASASRCITRIGDAFFVKVAR